MRATHDLSPSLPEVSSGCRGVGSDWGNRLSAYHPGHSVVGSFAIIAPTSSTLWHPRVDASHRVVRADILPKIHREAEHSRLRASTVSFRYNDQVFDPEVRICDSGHNWCEQRDQNRTPRNRTNKGRWQSLHRPIILRGQGPSGLSGRAPKDDRPTKAGIKLRLLALAI